MLFTSNLHQLHLKRSRRFGGCFEEKTTLLDATPPFRSHMQKAHGNFQPTAVYGKCRDSERPDDALQRLKLFTPEPIALIKSDKNLTVCETPVMLSPKRSPAQCESEMTFSYSRTYLRRKGSIQILEDAMRRRSKSTSNSSAQEQSAAERTSKGRPHFRPVRYEVATEIDQIFGSVSKQRENLALRVRDEEGLLWFDEIGMLDD